MQLPLPEHISPQLVCDSVTPVKDVDGFSVTNLGRLYAGTALHVPATAKGIEEMIKVSVYSSLSVYSSMPKFVQP